MNAPPKRTCKGCGCTDDDCRQCIEATGEPCFWVTEDMCSACADPAVVAQALERCAERNPLSNSRCVHAPYHAGDHLDGMGKGWTRDRMRVYDAPAPTTPTNTAPDPLAFTHGVLELVVEEAKRREAVVAGVRDALDGLLGSADASDLGGWIREELEAQLAKLRTAMDPGVQARAEPTLDETLTSKVTPQERLLVARLLEQADAAIATMRTHQEMRARIAELECELARADACVAKVAGEHAELEQELRDAKEREGRIRVKAHGCVAELDEMVRQLRRASDALVDVLDEWKLSSALREELRRIAVQLGDVLGDRPKRARAPRAASSGARAASTRVQRGSLADVHARESALYRAAQRADARQADSREKPAGSAEHGTKGRTAGPVPAARQKARAAEKQARDASFEAECRRREANRQRGPPSARDVAHVEQKKATKKKQTKRAAVRRRSPRKRGSP